ncbi:putative DNA repair protein, partial [Trichinella spiralis]
ITDKFKEWRKRKWENADDTKQIADDTKQIADDTKQIADDTKQIEDGTKQIEDHTKQNKRRQSSWDPNSVGLGLGYFERVKLSHSCN